MKALTHTTALILAVAATGVLAGCASVREPETPAPVLLGAASTSGSDAPAEITGSRIPTRRTEKMVSQIGGQDYKNNRAALPAPLESH